MTKTAKSIQHLTLPAQLPDKKDFVADIRRAPDRGFSLTPAQTRIALNNALRYIPAPLHKETDLRLPLPARGLSESQSNRCLSGKNP
jgi:hypothetical protein